MTRVSDLLSRFPRLRQIPSGIEMDWLRGEDMMLLPCYCHAVALNDLSANHDWHAGISKVPHCCSGLARDMPPYPVTGDTRAAIPYLVRSRTWWYDVVNVLEGQRGTKGNHEAAANSRGATRVSVVAEYGVPLGVMSLSHACLILVHACYQLQYSNSAPELASTCLRACWSLACWVNGPMWRRRTGPVAPEWHEWAPATLVQYLIRTA